MMYQKQNKRRKRSKKFFKALHIIVITLKYAFKILKELKAIIGACLVLCTKSISFIIILYFISFAIFFLKLT